MKKLATALLILLSIAANAQTIKHGDVVTGKTDSVYSRILGEKRKIYIYLPAGAADDQYAKAHYPVLYLLDGEGHFKLGCHHDTAIERGETEYGLPANDSGGHPQYHPHPRPRLGF
jgi:enterochelin esterase-like enzyme